MIEFLKRGNNPSSMLSIVSDFNILIELANTIGIESIVDICYCILKKKPLSDDSMVFNDYIDDY